MLDKLFFNTYFGVIDILSALAWLLVFIAAATIIYSRNRKKPEYTYYLKHFYWKVLLSFGFGLVYLLYYGGGDTTAYWEGAVKLNKLFYHSPTDYFNELFSTPTPGKLPSYFQNRAFRPPVWIYYDNNSWFVSKVASIFSFFTFGSYLTLNLFFGVISSWVSWKFFRFTLSYTSLKMRDVAIATLFIPTVGFWCSCLMKDTVVYIGLLIGTVGFMRMFHKETRGKISTWLYILVCVCLLFPTRAFVLLTIMMGILIIVVFQINKSKGTIIVLITRFTGISIALVVMNFYLVGSDEMGDMSVEKLMKNVEVTQNDFKYNETYTGKKYDLGEVEFSSRGMLRVAPAAIGTALFRPFIWEMGSPFMLLNGLENLFIVYLFFTFIRKLYREKSLSRIMSNHLFLYSLVLVLVLGYFVGLTSGLFGILVRMKAPILVFFVLLLASKDSSNLIEEHVEPTEE